MNEVEMQGKIEAVKKLSSCLLVSLREQDLNVGVAACLSIAIAALACAGATEEEVVKHITIAISLWYMDRNNEAANSTKH